MFSMIIWINLFLLYDYMDKSLFIVFFQSVDTYLYRMFPHFCHYIGMYPLFKAWAFHCFLSKCGCISIQGCFHIFVIIYRNVPIF